MSRLVCPALESGGARIKLKIDMLRPSVLAGLSSLFLVWPTYWVLQCEHVAVTCLTVNVYFRFICLIVSLRNEGGACI